MATAAVYCAHFPYLLVEDLSPGEVNELKNGSVYSII